MSLSGCSVLYGVNTNLKKPHICKTNLVPEIWNKTLLTSQIAGFLISFISRIKWWKCLIFCMLVGVHNSCTYEECVASSAHKKSLELRFPKSCMVIKSHNFKILSFVQQGVFFFGLVIPLKINQLAGIKNRPSGSLKKQKK